MESGHFGARATGLDVRKAVGAVNLAQAIRLYGHLAARLDPLGTAPPGDPSLQTATHNIDESDLRALPAALLPGGITEGASSMWDVVERLRGIYCSTTGYDLAHIFIPEERLWLRHAIETGRFRTPNDPIDPVALLERLTQVEAFETILQRSFPGKTRFSIEGLDTLVPILDELIAEAAEEGVRRGFVGMAHRGRLNVMTHVLGRPYAEILAAFRDPGAHALEREGVEWRGDVTYHLGASRAVSGGQAVALIMTMPPNPSHLEAVDPVLVGMARAAGTDATHGGAPAFLPETVLPILIHGDAAFSGQGVVAETLNLHRLRGYTTGGTIHIIANNQIGFTTDPGESYSTLYASGLARGFKVPILHVNADDPEACVSAARLAYAYRAVFKRDVLIDLVGYRRYGHNEGDEPSFTQPVACAKIATQPAVRQVWATTLEARGLIAPGRAEAMLQARLSELRQTLSSLDAEGAARWSPGSLDPGSACPEPGRGEDPGLHPVSELHSVAADRVTPVTLDRLRTLNGALLKTPDGFHVHRKMTRARERRRAILGAMDDRAVDWAAAEDLAFATILEDGVPIRITGQDVERGTFSQRHAVLHDATDGQRYTPLQNLPGARAAFEICNSPLSENAAVGFEIGYNVQAHDRLVLWEAQYGDFSNGAQVVLDEFLLSARAKWGLRPSLVLLLPHGHEGQGPDHSSARPERFLQLAADGNLRMATCTTAAQYFHLLRRQAALLETDPAPLVVLTPKSLLRHPFMASAPRDLTEGHWMGLIDDAEARARAGEVQRLVLCGGKIAVDLLTSPHRQAGTDVAICRVEQLYPFPVDEIGAVIGGYPRLDEIVWVQEEPENMGAWESVRPSLQALVGTKALSLLARPRSSSPAEGSARHHVRNQEQIVAGAFHTSNRTAATSMSSHEVLAKDG